MAELHELEGDLLTFQCDYIVQQCNCLTVRSHGLSESLEKRYPYAMVYSKRRGIGRRNLTVPEDRDQPGSYKLFPDDQKIGPTVVALFGQWRPGRLGTTYFNSYPESNPTETATTRLSWFRHSLFEFGSYLWKLNKKVKIALPYEIGCGLAGGNWEDYHLILVQWTNNLPSGIEVYLVRLMK